MRLWRDPSHPDNLEVYDEDVMSVPQMGGPVRAVPIMFVADWIAEEEPRDGGSRWAKARPA